MIRIPSLLVGFGYHPAGPILILLYETHNPCKTERSEDSGGGA
jgi:hypothetical protein